MYAICKVLPAHCRKNLVPKLPPNVGAATKRMTGSDSENRKWKRSETKKVLLVMKLTAIILLVCCLQVSAKVSSQVISLTAKEVKLEKIFTAIKQQTGYTVVVNARLIKSLPPVSVEARNEPLTDFLTGLLTPQSLDFSIENKTIVISRAKKVEIFTEPVTPEVEYIEVRGRVVDSAGAPLFGASVMIKGTNKGTTTNARGEFSINAQPEDMLVVSFVGYLPLEIPAKTFPSSVILKKLPDDLESIIINKGYYSERKKTSTSNVSSISSKDIENQPVNNPLLALAGRVPGIQITQNNGIPGSGIVVRIQGRNSIDRGNDPFYVVDGVPISNQMPMNLSAILGNNGNPGTGTSTTNSNPLAYLNPADIETIDILKDADAVAIYGSQASNGAVLITTKKGKAGQSRLDLTLQNGWGKVGNFMNLMKTDEYLTMRREAFKNDGLAIPTLQANPVSGTNAANNNYDLTVWDPNKYTDWQKELIGGTATFRDAQVAFSGGNNNTSFRMNAGYHKETTVFPGNSSDTKGSFGFNINHISTNQRFKLQLTGNYLIDQNKLISSDLTAAALRLAPNAPTLYNEDGSLNWAQIPASNGSMVSTWTNPLNKLYIPNTLRINNLISNGLISYEILKDLNIKSSFGYSRVESSDMQLGYLEANLPEQRSTSQRGATYIDGRTENWIIEPQVTYQKKLGQGMFNVLLGSTFQASSAQSKQINSFGYANDILIQNLASATSWSSVSSDSKYRYSAAFGRLNYNWQDKYIVNLTERRDGTSRFGAQSRLHNFWSAGGAWIFSNEDFAKKWVFLSFGKFRMSYGTSGNQQIGDYQYLSLYNSLNVGTAYGGVSALLPAGLSNPFLEWELTKKLSIGSEIGFFKDRIQISADFFQNRSSNQLLRYNLPIQTGFPGIFTNFPATLQNKGWEFTLSSLNITSTEWSWRTNFNASIWRNKLQAFTDLATSAYASTYIIGEPTSLIRLFNYAGVDPATGEALFYKADGSTTKTPSTSGTVDKIYFYYPFPKWSGGFQSSLTWKQFSFDIMLQYVNQQRSSLNSGFNGPGTFGGTSNTGNLPTSFSDHWRNPGDNASLEKFRRTNFYNDNAATFSNLAYTDGSFLRVKNASLSYQLPEAWQHHLTMKSARIFLNAQNLYTFTKYKGLDPETGVFSLPPLRTITFGIQATF